MYFIIKNKRTVSIEKKIINPYSPTDSRANPLLLNSVLNPLTNSLSPSAKSNGVRLHSAKILISHIIINGEINIINSNFKKLLALRFKDFRKKIKLKIQKIRVNS